MSDARSIADTRLAKGEITPEEHAKIISSLTVGDHESPKPIISRPAIPDVSPSGISKDGAFWWIIISAGLFLGVINSKPSDTHTLDPIGWVFVFALVVAFMFGVIKAAFGK